MSRHLCISVTFLDPWFHGQCDEGPEWPPSPLRLFQALLAGARAGCRANEWSFATAESFRWLEEQQPPSIVAPGAVRAPAYNLLFVPNNDSDEVPDRQGRLTSKVRWPHRLEGGDTVHYLWQIEDSDWPSAERHVELLCREARNLLALGWGIDQVVGNGRALTDEEASALPGSRWRPWRRSRSAERTWRVPTGGTLEDLDRVYQSFLKRVDGRQLRPSLKPSRFSTVVYRTTQSLPPRPHAVFELPEGVAFRPEDAAKAAAMLRSLAISRAQTDRHAFPGGIETYVAGHAGGQQQTPPRFSYLPLPTIGHPHADSMIRRLLIAEPFGGDGTHAEWARRRLRHAALRDEEGNERGLLLDLWRKTSQGVVDRYVNLATTWLSVTPVVLPGFDDGRQAKAERLLFAALEHAEIRLEAVRDVALRKAPFWPGSQHPRLYFLPDYLRGRPAWHVRLVFCAPVPGPLAIGAGRHAGLGLFASLAG